MASLIVDSAVQQTQQRSSGLQTNAYGSAASSKAPLDAVCVGFGLSGLAIAAVLADRYPDANVCFLEQQESFSWKEADILSDNKVQSSFLHDLVTSRNPRSQFTFINYLYSTNQLVNFTNASSLQPSKHLMGMYLTWVAKRIAALDWVRYGCDVVRVEPQREADSSQVNRWAVLYQNRITGARSVVTSRRVIIATGGVPYIPTALSDPSIASYVVHTASEGLKSKLQGKQDRTVTVAIVGGSQEGAEVFEYLQSAFGQYRATLFISDSALRPVDTSPFAASAIDYPETDAALFPPEIRTRLFHGNSGPSPCPVSLELIEKLYDNQYAQRIYERDPKKWQFQIEPLAEVVGFESVDAPPQSRVMLELKNPRTGELRRSERSFDVVVTATGYLKVAKSLLSSVSDLTEGGDFVVGSDYSVNLKRGAVQAGCGLWVLGTLNSESSSDSLFLHVAEQGQRIADSVLRSIQQDTQQSVLREMPAML